MSFLELSEKWEYRYIPDLTQGLDFQRSPILLQDNNLVVGTNVYSDNGILKNDNGYAKFGVAVRGEPRLDYQFFKKDGSEEFILVTNDTVYVWNNDEWQYVSDGNSTTTTNDEVAGQTVIEVPSTTGFTANDHVGIGLSDSTQHQTTIASISVGVSITIDDAIPSGKNTGAGATVLKAVDLTGTLDVQISVVTIPSHDWMVFTNGIDNVQRYNGTDCIDVPNLPSGGNTQARVVGIFNNHLVLGHTTEGGTKYPQRVRNADTGNPEDWTGGNAGYTDLYDNEDWIIAIAFLGPYMMFYRERSIVRTEYVGSTDLLFNFETTIAGEGVLSQDSVIDLGDSHIFIGNSNIYEYKGGFDSEPIGDPIYPDIFGSKGELNNTYKNRVFGFYVEELDEVWFFYSTTGNDNPTRMLRYLNVNGSWLKRSYNHDVIGFGFYQSTADKSWSELVGDWTAQDWSWDSKSVTANSPTIHLLSSDNLQVYDYDYVQTTDDGTDISYEVQTKDFGHPRFKTRVDMFDFRILGTSILVEYSLDEGITWTTLGTITQATLDTVTIHKQLVFQYLRLRFTGTSTFQLQSVAFMHRVESEF